MYLVSAFPSVTDDVDPMNAEFGEAAWAMSGRVWTSGWPILDWLRSLRCEEPVRSWTCDDEISEDDDYSHEKSYGATVSQVYGVASGADPDVVSRYKVEGLLVRSILAAMDHGVRLQLVLLWQIVIMRMVGKNGMIDPPVLHKVSVTDHSTGVCPEGMSSNLLRGFMREQGNSITMEVNWLKVLQQIDTRRENYIQRWCYDVQYCGVHGRNCEKICEMIAAYKLEADRRHDTEEDDSDGVGPGDSVSQHRRQESPLLIDFD